MLMTLTLRHPQASDLGYLLYKHPDRVQHVDLSFGKVHIFYPHVSEEEATAALLLEVDPVGLSRRGSGGNGSFALYPYVNDRPYVSSSFLSVAISQALGTALSGTSVERPKMASEALDFEVSLTALPCRGGEGMVRALFEPLGYRVDVETALLDPAFEQWGQSPYVGVRLRAEVRLTDLLSHLYVLVPVLDVHKHYYIGKDEVEKLLRHGEGWLPGHPEREAIATRYLDRRSGLVRMALERMQPEETGDEELEDEVLDAQERVLERPVSLHTERLDTVAGLIKQAGAATVLDLGCGEGKLVRRLLRTPGVEKVMGVDVSWRALEVAHRRLRVGRMSEREASRVELTQGSLLYRDKRLRGWDAAALVEVIEHVEPERLPALMRNLFGDAQPQSVIITTPNAEYNALFETLPAGKFRHGDHRFEWSRQEFSNWVDQVTSHYPYRAEIQPLGPLDPEHGAPSQLALFTKKTDAGQHGIQPVHTDLLPEEAPHDQTS